VDPFNPDIVYAQSQYGVLVRYDRKSGEELGIQPKERKGEDGYRWNWDAPLIASPHQAGRIYFAANKVFRSNDYGHSWEVISEDLTQQIDRNTLKVYDRVVSMHSVMKNASTSPYGTIVAMAESPIIPDMIAVGTDDGLVQITRDGGQNWNNIPSIPGAPRQSYVNSVYLSQHDENVIYVAYNHHKYGDFKPYLFRSADGGNTWKSISHNLPERGSVYAIEEDHEQGDLIFCGTEFGVYFSPNAGQEWKKLGGGLPTIAVRDIAIQRRENDLVLGTFGRGFYVMDDYTALRELTETMDEPQIYAVRDALMWEKDAPLGLPRKSFQGDDYYLADNLGPVALIRYYCPDEFKSAEDERKKKEKENSKAGKDTPYPSYDELKAESDEKAPKLVFLIKDSEGTVVKQMTADLAKGIKTLSWDMRYNETAPIDLSQPSFYNPFAGKSEGTLVSPGTYTVEMHEWREGGLSPKCDPVSFNIKALNNTVMPAENRQDKIAFQKEVEALSAEISEAGNVMGEIRNKVRHIKKAVEVSSVPMTDAWPLIESIEQAMQDIRLAMYGDPIKSQLDIGQPVTPAGRIGWIVYEQKYSTSAPTQTHMDSYAIAKEEFMPIRKQLDELLSGDVAKLEQMLDDVGAPYTPGRVKE